MKKTGGEAAAVLARAKGCDLRSGSDVGASLLNPKGSYAEGKEVLALINLS
ncbi:hypothetical protein LC593_13715 [Nostoc sp. CHAB 5844]|nr:hypothetical protein [Nostoc sp. CHAB 5844]